MSSERDLDALPPGPFVKIYGSILDSSIWRESGATRLLWITLLAISDADGYVRASVGGLAYRANISIEDCRSALAVLEAPDPDDRSGVDDGRRIRRLQGGWHILNYESYREMRTPRQIKGAERVARHRERHRESEQDQPLLGVTSVTVTPEREGERERDTTTDPYAGWPKSSIAGQTLMGQLTREQACDVTAFLETRPGGTWARWLREMLRMIGPATGSMPEDLAAACSDALLVTPPAESPIALAAFVTRRRQIRFQASAPAPTSPRNGRKPTPPAPYSTDGNEAATRRLARDLGGSDDD